jgi:ComF family protein
MIELNEAICPVCERLAVDGRTHPGCRSRYAIDGLISFFHYDGIIRIAIKKIKYSLVSDVVEELINLIPLTSYNIAMSNQLDSKIYHPIIIPIPLHAERFRSRGFNQAEILGKYLSVRLNLPVRSDILIRKKKTDPQVEMKSRKERLNNLKDVFAVRLPMMRKMPLTVLLLDDVFTTGATMRAAATVLKRAGVKCVWGMTIAR